MDGCSKMVMLFHLTFGNCHISKGTKEDEASHLITAAGAKLRNEHECVTQSQKLPAQFISDKIDSEQCVHFSPMLWCSSVNEWRKLVWGVTSLASGRLLVLLETGDQYLNSAK